MYLLRLEVRAEDDVLPALAPGDPDPAGDQSVVEPAADSPTSTVSDEDALACSLENPETCEACQ